MSVKCPATGRLCIDDLCCGGSCMMSASEDPIRRCPMCGQWDDPIDGCACDEREFDDDEEAPGA